MRFGQDETPWDNMQHSLRDYINASRRRTFGHKRPRSAFKLVPDDSGDSDRNQRAKADFR
jgi:hypothetical protein